MASSWVAGRRCCLRRPVACGFQQFEELHHLSRSPMSTLPTERKSITLYPPQSGLGSASPLSSFPCLASSSASLHKVIDFRSVAKVDMGNLER